MGFGEILREFGVKVNLAFDGKEVDKAQNKIEKFAAELRSFAVEASAVSAGLLGIQNSFTSNARSLSNQANLLGINTDELQQYEYAAKVLGDVNRDELVASFQKLGNTMDLARAGNVDARRALEQLGGMSGNVDLVLGRLNDRTYKVTDAFKDMAVGIQKINQTSPLAASRIVQETLGSADLLNVLREGPGVINNYLAAGQKNYQQNQKMIEQGKKMDQEISALWLTFKKFFRDVGFSVSTVLMPLIREITHWAQTHKKLISSGIITFLKTMVSLTKILFHDFIRLVEIAQPLIEKIGGMERAVRLLVGAWIAYKTLEIGSSFVGMISAISKAAPFLMTFASALWGAGKALKAFTLIEGIADIVPALQLFGTGALAALSPLLPVLLAITAAGFALHEIMALINGDQTWTGQAVDKIKDTAKNLTGAFSNISASGAGSVYGMAKGGIAEENTPNIGPQTQQNTFYTTNHIVVPKGTTPADAANIISSAMDHSNAKVLVKTKQDAGRTREQ